MRTAFLVCALLCCFAVAQTAEGPSKSAESESIKTAHTEAEKMTGLSYEGVHRKHHCEVFFYSSLEDRNDFGKLKEFDRTELRHHLGDSSFFLHRFTPKDPKKPGFEIFVSGDGTKILWKRAFPDQQTVVRLVQRIRSQLPKGWTASYDREDSWLEIERVKSVLWLPAIPNRSLADKPEEGTVSIAFRVVPYVAPSEYGRLKDENDRLQKEANALYEDLSKRVRPSKDSFDPSTEAEKKEMARYEQIRQSIRNLPEYYFGNISLRSVYPRWLRYAYNTVEDEAIREECERTHQKILRLLSSYIDQTEER